MITHDQLIYTLRAIYPQITAEDHGRKYWVGMPVEGETQTGPAFIVESRDPVVDGDGEITGLGPNKLWTFGDIEQPSAGLIAQTWESVKNEYTQLAAAQDARVRRDALLIEADKMVSRATDSGDAESLAAARAYRQALRDVPQQAGFPDSIEWPSL